MKSLQPPTLVSLASSSFHPFSALTVFFRASFSTFSSLTTLFSSSFNLKVILRLLHSKSTMYFRPSIFHRSWNSSEARKCSNIFSLSPLNRTRNSVSPFISFLYSLTTFFFAWSRLKSISFLKSIVVSNFCACPMASNAIDAFGWLHLSGCTNKDTFRNALATSWIVASKRTFKYSYGFNLKHDNILSTSLARSVCDTSLKNSFKSVSSSFNSSIFSTSVVVAVVAAVVAISLAIAAFSSFSSLVSSFSTPSSTSTLALLLPPSLGSFSFSFSSSSSLLFFFSLVERRQFIGRRKTSSSSFFFSFDDAKTFTWYRSRAGT